MRDRNEEHSERESVPTQVLMLSPHEGSIQKLEGRGARAGRGWAKEGWGHP